MAIIALAIALFIFVDPLLVLLFSSFLCFFFIKTSLCIYYISNLLSTPFLLSEGQQDE